MKNVIIIGAGGHAKVIADIIMKSGDTLVGFLDDDQKLPKTILGYPNFGAVSNVFQYEDSCSFVIGIGNNEIRKEIAEKYDLDWYTAIHPSAQIALDVEIGRGTVVMAGAVINTSAKIGRHCVVNTSAVVEHDNSIGDFVHVSPNATLCGTVTVGALSHIGASATIRNNLNVCPSAVIGMGACVVSDIIEKGTYVGVPAKIVEQERQ